MQYADRRRQDIFYYEEAVAMLRSYIKAQRPQSFAMSWNLFIRLYKKVKECYGYSTPVTDLFEYARKERIGRFGSDIVLDVA